MNAELITNWTDHDRSLHHILELATRSLRIFDEDLSKLKLESADNAGLVHRLLASDRLHTVQILLKNADPVQRNSPRLMQLLRQYPESMSITECLPHLANLSEALLIADENHALVRFHMDNVRCKTIIGSAEECALYLHRFEEIRKEGGDQIGATPLGL